MTLESYRSNVYSQFGEDGILEELLDRLQQARIQLTNWCVELGAWDGVHLSNTCNLIRNRGFSAVLIEGEVQRFKDLVASHPKEDVVKVCQFVGLDGETSFENILRTTPVPRDFDVLSIDIDGCDYWLLDSLSFYEPKIVCVEFNPTIPNGVEYVQPRDLSLQKGSSPLSLVKLATQRGYTLVAATDTNLILLRAPLAQQLNLEEKLDDVRDDTACVVYAFSGYDGEIILSGDLRFPWHNILVSDRHLKPVPKFWRSFPGSWGRLHLHTWRLMRRKFK